MKKLKKICQASILVFGLLFSVKSIYAQAISNNYFGVNAWMPDSIGAVRYNGKLHNNWASMKNSGTTIIRFGGIAPDEDMPTNYQYIKMIDSARAKGIEPIIQVPFNNGEYTAQQAANIVNYINITKGRNIKYWIIANEPNLVYSYTSASQVAAYFKPFASAMKNVDPSILIIGPETAGFHTSILTGLTTPGGASDITGKDASGRYYVDIISFHTYPMGDGVGGTRAELIGNLTADNALEDDLIYLNGRIAACNTYHSRTGAAALKTAITEANVNYLNPSDDNLYGLGSNSFLGGQFYSEILGMGLMYGVAFVNLWSVIEGNSTTTNKGYIDKFTGGKKPIYHHFKLMAENFKGTNVNCTDNQTNIKSFACKDAQQITVLVLNEDQASNHNYTVRLNTATISGASTLKVNVNASVASEYTSVLPSQSTVLLTFNSAGVLIKKCEYSLLVHAVANQAPTCTEFPVSATNAGNNAVVCAGISTTLNASGASTYAWKPATGLSATNTASVNASPIVTTSYSVTGTDVNGYSTTDVVLVTVNNPVQPNAGSDVVLCSGASAPLNATGSSAYSWKPAAGLNATNTASVTASPVVTTNYSVTGTDANGCSATDVVLVTVNSPMHINAGNDIALCKGGTVPLNATGASAYSWKPAAGLSATNTANVTASPVVTTNYSVTGTDANGCSATDVVLVIVNSPLLDAGNDIVLCSGASAPLNATGLSAYSWKPSAGLSATNAATVNASPAATTTYSVTGTDENGCTATDDVLVTVSASLIANAGSDLTINSGSSAVLDGSGGSKYSWSPATGLDNPTIANPTASPDVNTNYTLTVSSGDCPPAFDYVTVMVSLLPDITDTIAEETVGTAIAENSNLFKMAVFPNPSTGKFTIELTRANSEGENLEVEVFSLTGQEVYRKNAIFLNGKEDVELPESIARGAYVLRVKEGDKVSSKRIVLSE